MDAGIDPLKVIVFLFFLSAIWQLGYLLYFHLRLVFYKPVLTKGNYIPVSIIIAARNEEEFLRMHLPFILDQDYPEYEVVVTNDASWDDTAEILKAFSVKHKNLKIVSIPENQHAFAGKKLALTLAIKAARFDTFLFTDADCKPAGNQWLKKMVEAKGEGEIVLGYGPYQKQKSFLNLLVRFDAFSIAINYLSFALSGIPYMGVGRNLLYTRKVYDKAGGFRKHYHIASGDDDLFIHAAATPTNTRVNLDKSSFTYSIPKKTFYEWWKQKRRHSTTGYLYKSKIKWLLMSYPVSYLLFLITSILLLVFQKLIYIVISLLICRILIQFFIFRLSMKDPGEHDLPWMAVFLEPIVIVFNGFVHLINLFSKPRSWKR